MLRRILGLLAVVLGLTLSASAQRDGSAMSIRSYLETYPHLDAQTKDLILDAIDAGEPKRPPYQLYGVLELLWADAETLSVRTSELSISTFRLLPRPNAKPLLAVIETVEEPLVDSQLLLYDTDWQPVEAKGYWQVPTAEDFLRGHREADELRPLLTPLYTRYTLDDAGVLSAQVVVPNLLDENRREAQQGLIEALPVLRYRWQGTRYQRM
ncbi:MAG: DUF3256 family protein [Porphyromonas sp.]|nr:DUF3256 family protein [Porphyromonas sp.]